MFQVSSDTLLQRFCASSCLELLSIGEQCISVWVRNNLPKNSFPKPNLPNVKDYLPNFFSANRPFELAEFCRDNLPNT